MPALPGLGVHHSGWFSPPPAAVNCSLLFAAMLFMEWGKKFSVLLIQLETWPGLQDGALCTPSPPQSFPFTPILWQPKSALHLWGGLTWCSLPLPNGSRPLFCIIAGSWARQVSLPIPQGQIAFDLSERNLVPVFIHKEKYPWSLVLSPVFLVNMQWTLRKELVNRCLLSLSLGSRRF